MRVPVISIEGKPLMPTRPAKCRKLLRDGLAEKHWSKEGVFYIKMLVSTEDKVQDMALAIDPGSKYDGYCVSGVAEVVLMGMVILPSRVKKRMETRHMLRRSRRSRKCRRRETRFNNRRTKGGWIAPSQLAKIQLRIRLMERLCRLFPVTDIVIEDIRFNHWKYLWGKHFSTVEIGKTKVYESARQLARLWLAQGWETADTRKTYGIDKCKEKNRLAPESHANDAWAMVCWLLGEKPSNTVTRFFIWKRQEHSRRQLHLQCSAKGGVRKKYGGTTSTDSSLRKGDVVECKNIVAYVGGWAKRDSISIALTGNNGKRIRQAGAGTVRLLARSPNMLVERRMVHLSQG